jgi:hypothetical protein
MALMQARQKLAWPQGERQIRSFGFTMQITQSSSELSRTKLKYVKLQVTALFNFGKVRFLENDMTTLYRQIWLKTIVLICITNFTKPLEATHETLVEKQSIR